MRSCRKSAEKNEVNIAQGYWGKGKISINILRLSRANACQIFDVSFSILAYIISRPAINPVLRVLQPQVRLPADSKKVPHAMQDRTLILIWERLANRRAWFFSSMSLTTEGGNFLILSLVSTIDVSKSMRNLLSRMVLNPRANSCFWFLPIIRAQNYRFQFRRGIYIGMNSKVKRLFSFNSIST